MIAGQPNTRHFSLESGEGGWGMEEGAQVFSMRTDKDCTSIMQDFIKGLIRITLC